MKPVDTVRTVGAVDAVRTVGTVDTVVQVYGPVQPLETRKEGEEEKRRNSNVMARNEFNWYTMYKKNSLEKERKNNNEKESRSSIYMDQYDYTLMTEKLGLHLVQR